MSLRWIAIVGDNLTAAAVRTAVHELGFAVVNGGGTFTLYIDERPGPLTIDSVDSPFERLLVKHLRSCGAGDLRIQDETGVRSDLAARVILPPLQASRVAVVGAIVRAFSDEQARCASVAPCPVLRAVPVEVTVAPPAPPPTWWERLRAWCGLGLVLLALLPATAAAQSTVTTVRDSTTGAVVPTIGSSAAKAMRIICVSGCGGGTGGTSLIDEAVFTFGVDNLTPIGGVYDEAAPLLTTGMAGIGRLSENRNFYMQIRDGAGNERGAHVTASGALEVTCDNCGGAAFADNSAFTFDTSAVFNMGAVVDDTAPNAVDENSAGAPRMTPNRNLHTTIRDAAGNERGANVTAGNALVVDGSAVTQPISAAALPLPAGAATAAGQLPDGHNVTVDNGAGAAAVNVQDGGNSLTVDGTVTATATDLDIRDLAFATDAVDVSGSAVDVASSALPTGAATEATVAGLLTDAELRAAPVPISGTVTVTDGAGALNVIVDSGTVTANAGTGTFTVLALRAATPAVTSVADSAGNVTCLASNANRLGATIYNDSAADLFIKLGATASATSFTVKVFQDGFFTVPFGYTGIIDCIWSSDTAGSARVTEVTQ